MFFSEKFGRKYEFDPQVVLSILMTPVPMELEKNI